jgi:hypothetical protein
MQAWRSYLHPLWFLLGAYVILAVVPSSATGQSGQPRSAPEAHGAQDVRPARSAPSARGAEWAYWASRIARCESGGHYQARNPRSRASGRYQVVSATWAGMPVSRKRPSPRPRSKNGMPVSSTSGPASGRGGRLVHAGRLPTGEGPRAAVDENVADTGQRSRSSRFCTVEVQKWENFLVAGLRGTDPPVGGAEGGARPGPSSSVFRLRTCRKDQRYRGLIRSRLLIQPSPSHARSMLTETKWMPLSRSSTS